MNRILRFVLLLAKTVIESIRIEGGDVIVGVRPHKSAQRRCPICGRRCDFYDAKADPRRWRTLDMGWARCFLEHRPARVRCPKHGVRVEAVPWARHRSRFTRPFEDWVAWMAVHCTVSAVADACRVEWHSVGGICARVYDDLERARGTARFDGVRRIGIDETSYKRNHKYLMVVVDHDRGCLIWAAEGWSKDVLKRFLKGLTWEQRQAIEVVTADGCKWIKRLVKRWCPNAEWVMDPFHVISWMNDALDAVRCEEWQVAKKAAREAMPKRGRPGRPAKGDETPPKARALAETAKAVKSSRFALVKGRENLTDAQKGKLKELERVSSHLFRTWELKEDLRAVYKASSAEEAEEMLADWLHRAAYCKIAKVVEVEKKIRARRDDVVRSVALGISNARVEAINNKIKVTIRMGYGFRNTDNLIALLMLKCSDSQPQLPWTPPKKAKVKNQKAA
jgi:transposase